jgi:putative nucleotidyltransferase with HDIG domain
MGASQGFRPVAIDLLRRFKRPMVFDIYLKRTEDNYTKLFHRNDPIDWERVNSYQLKGSTQFYVTDEDFKIYCLFVDKLGEYLKDQVQDMDEAEALAMLKDLVQYSLFEMVERHRLDEQTVSLAGQIITTCVEDLGNNKNALLQFVRAMATSPYLYKHATSVSVMSILLAKSMGIEVPSNLKNIGMGALLHDVGEGQLDFDPEEKEILTAEERKKLWQHPQLGKEFLENSGLLKREVLEIVLQHHEQPNGHGYPLGLRDAEIYPPAKIVGVVDTFCALLSARPWREAFSAEAAFEKMQDDKGKYCTQVMKALKQMLSIANQ